MGKNGGNGRLITLKGAEFKLLKNKKATGETAALEKNMKITLVNNATPACTFSQAFDMFSRLNLVLSKKLTETEMSLQPYRHLLKHAYFGCSPRQINILFKHLIKNVTDNPAYLPGYRVILLGMVRRRSAALADRLGREVA